MGLIRRRRPEAAATALPVPGFAAQNHAGFSNTWRFLPMESLMTPS
jgi:hypothetical protein